MFDTRPSEGVVSKWFTGPWYRKRRGARGIDERYAKIGGYGYNGSG